MKIPLVFITIILGIFPVFAQIPGVFSLQSPSSGATNVALKPTLTWSSSYNAASYKVQISQISGFSSPQDLVVDEAGITSTSYTLTSESG